MNKIILRNKLLATRAICAVTLVSSNSYAVNISQYIQSSYGEGDASVTIDVVGTPVEVKYQSIYGEGDQSKNYTINILGQDVDIIAKYHSENLNTGYENYGEDHSNETIIRDFVDVESCYNGVLNQQHFL